MVSLGAVINVSELPESSGSFDPLPAGQYAACCIEAEAKDTKAGTGQYIRLTWEVLDEPYAGRRIWQNLNVRNPNPTAQEIGMKQLGEVCRAMGLVQIQDTDEFIGGNAILKLKIRKSEEYGDSNDVLSVRAMEGSAAPAPAAASPGKKAPAAKSATPPWGKKA